MDMVLIYVLFSKAVFKEPNKNIYKYSNLFIQNLNIPSNNKSESTTNF